MSHEMKKQLISEVEARPCLWNPLCEEYHKADKRMEAWAAVKDSMRRNGFEYEIAALKSSWKNLKDHWRKRQNLPTGSAAPRPWAFMESLSFLREGEARGVRFSNLSLRDPGEGVGNDDAEGLGTHPPGPPVEDDQIGSPEMVQSDAIDETPSSPPRATPRRRLGGSPPTAPPRKRMQLLETGNY
ncbi:hypothetical protein Aduo_006411 [Ancylostoma duodenale]